MPTHTRRHLRRGGRWRSGGIVAGLSLAVLTGVTGCTWPDVSMSPGVTDDVGADASATPETTAPAGDTDPGQVADATVVQAAETTPARVPGDLDTGSVTHVLAAGSRTVVVDYWTTDAATTWTAAGDKTIQLSAHVEDDDTATTILVTRFVVTADDGTVRAAVVEDRGEFALTPPFGYGTAFTVPASTADATAVRLAVQFDLLIETEPGSQRYFRQTVLDALDLPLVQEDTP